MNNSSRCLNLAFLIYFSAAVSAKIETITDRAPLVYLVQFAPSKTSPEPALSSLIANLLGEELIRYGWEVRHSDADNTGNKALQNEIEKARLLGSKVLVAGFYARTGTGELRLYAQMYSVDKGILIDAHIAEPLSEVLTRSGVDLEDIKMEDEKLISAINRRLSLSLRSNPNLNVRTERITENALSVPSLKEYSFPLVKESEEKDKGSDVFRLLAEKEDTISIVSRRVGSSETVSRAAAIVSVFSRRQIEQSGARNLTDMLKLVPGVEVFYDQFGYYKVAFRGIRSKSGVLLLLDGHRINNFYDGSTFLDIRADVIEKIEIIRGPGSSVHGTNAFTGVINVVTRDPGNYENNILQYSARIGSFRTSEHSGYAAESFGEFKLGLQAHLYDSDRQSFHIPHDITCSPSRYASGSCDRTEIPLPENKNIRTNDRKHQLNVFTDIMYKDNYYLTANYLREKRGPNVGELNIVTPESELNMHLLLLSIGAREITLGKISLSGRMYTDFTRREDSIQVEREDILLHAFRSPRKNIAYDAQTFGGEVLAQYDPRKDLSLLFGTQLEYLGVSHYSISQNYQGTFINDIFDSFADYDNLPKEQIRGRFITGVFSQAVYSPLSWFSLTAGLRFDHYSDFGSTFNPKGGAVATVLDSAVLGELTVKALYGRAFRAPTIQELYDQTQFYLVGGVYGDPELKPETIETGELGIEYVTPYKPIRIMANGYYNRIKNNIDGFSTSGTLPTSDDKYRNLRGIETVGMEGTLRVTFDPGNYLYLNASLARSRDFGGFPPYENVDVITSRLDVPQLRANIVGHTGMVPWVDIFTSLNYSSFRAANYRYSFEATEDRRFRFEEYWVWNASIASAPDLIRNARLRLTVFNILDKEVFDDLNGAVAGFENRAFPREGRYVEIRAEISLDR